jgi:hypothetical protein
MQRNIIKEVNSSLLAMLFIYAAISKLKDLPVFRLQLARSPFIGDYAPIIVFVLPIFEISIAILLIFPHKRLWGLYCSLFLMTLFTAYLFSMLHFSYYIPCSCGGVISTLTWQQHIVFNAFFILLSVTAILLERTDLETRKSAISS